MTEIRPIKRDEAQEFLALLCESFDLDVERAKGIFFREPMFDVDRKWAYFVNGKIESILTTVPLIFGWGRAIGIAGVATRLCSRGQGLARDLLKEVLRVSGENGEQPALLFAKQTDLYESVGFKELDQVCRAKLEPEPYEPIAGSMRMEEIVRIYDQWASGCEHRLRRDQLRWDYWRWNLRVCTPFETGYLCVEGSVVRECIFDRHEGPWPVHEGTEWIGLRTMSETFNVPMRDPQFELYLMGYGFDAPPEMFITDQF